MKHLQIVDYVNVMTYDGNIHASMEEFEEGIKYWSARGVPKEKINIGAPFYSRPSEVSFAKLVQFDPAAAQVDSFEYNGTSRKITTAFPPFKPKHASQWRKLAASCSGH